MADFGNQQEALAGFSKKLKEQAAAASGAPTNTETPIVSPAAPAAPPIPPTPAQPTTQTPVAPEKVIELKVDPVSTEPVKPAEEEVVAWDGTPTKVTVKPEEPITLESISSALKIDSIKSTDELVAQFTKQATRIKELETAQEQPLSDLPEELKEVLNIAKQKGDWKAFLGTKVIDYSKVDPAQLFERQLELSPRFRKADGSIDYDAVDLELNSIPPAVKEIQGDLIKQQLVATQAQQRSAVIQAAEQKASAFNKSLADAATKLPSILSKEKVGVTMEPKHSDLLYQGVRNGSLIKKHLGNIDVSGADAEKLVRTLAAAEYLEGISQHQHAQGIVLGKKSMLSEKQNVNLNTPSLPVNPTVAGEKPKSAADKLRDRSGLNTIPGVRTL